MTALVELSLLELQLLQSSRMSAGEVCALLADDFIEYGSSGRKYTKTDVLDLLAEDARMNVSADDFSLTGRRATYFYLD